MLYSALYLLVVDLHRTMLGARSSYVSTFACAIHSTVPTRKYPFVFPGLKLQTLEIPCVVYGLQELHMVPVGRLR